jgi:hypothetical protein
VIEVVKFRPAHLDELRLQPSQEYLSAFVGRPGYGQELVEAGPCYTVRRDGKIICCAGVVNLWTGRASAWALLSWDAGKSMRPLHREVLKFLDRCEIRRVEAYVYPAFEPGHRWARMLGFEFEGLMRAFGQDGNDMAMYARIR